ncbi:claudin-9-like [Sardina pilchardus]|uniref:claudin-9-like n=1 Tax=Sardina pilchardus TaxID=27697 RepID=UPI002E0E5441
MATTGLQVLGVLLAVLGWVGEALVTAAPFWRVSAFVGGELVVAEAQWEGLWMSCLVRPGSGHTQCKSFDSGLALPAGTQLRRGLALLALLMGVLALGLSVLGMKCTRCLGDDGGQVDIGVRESKARLARAGGALFAAAAAVFLVPVCWTAYAVVRDFYDPAVAPPLKRELGPALYLGWGVALLMLVGGALINAGSAPPTGGGAGGRGGTSGGVAAAGAYGGGKSNPQPTPPEGKKEKAYV